MDRNRSVKDHGYPEKEKKNKCRPADKKAAYQKEKNRWTESEQDGILCVRRTLGDEALLVVHTFESGANPPVSAWTQGYREIKRFGSPLDGELRGAVIWCRKEDAGEDLMGG